MHTASCSPTAQWQGQPVANAAQGYRLGLPSIAHASPASAARNEKCQFSGLLGPLPIPPPNFWGVKTIHGVRWSYPEIFHADIFVEVIITDSKFLCCRDIGFDCCPDFMLRSWSTSKFVPGYVVTSVM